MSNNFTMSDFRYFYEKLDENIDTALAIKLNKSDVDASLSSTSTNPVQNKAVQAPLARLVDAGEKNLLKITATTQTINGVTFTVNDDGTITVNGKNTINDITSFTFSEVQVQALPNGYRLLGCPSGGSYYKYFLNSYNEDGLFLNDFGDGGYAYPDTSTTVSFDICVGSGATVNNLIFKPMFCTIEDYTISPEFVPYAKSNYELTRDVSPIPNLVDSGAKNLFNQSESYALEHISNDNGVYTTSGDTLTTLRLQITKYLNGALVKHVMHQLITSNGVYHWEFTKDSTFDSFMIGHNGSTYNGRFRYDLGKLENGRSYVIRIDITRCSDSNGSFQWRDIMICTKAAWDVSRDFVPYAMSNRALTEKTELVDITSQINMETSFALDSRSRLYKQGNHIFGNLIICRESDNIPTGQIVCCTLPYPPTISYTGGAFISSDSYDVTALGYVFIMSSYSTAGRLTIKSSASGAGNYIFIQLNYVC